MLKSIASGLLEAWPGLAFCLSALAAMGCPEGVASAEARLPDEFCGRWRLVGSSGGIHGRGAEVPGDQTMVLGRENVMEIYRAGRLESRSRFSVSRGRSITTGAEAWQITPEPGGMTRVIRLNADGTLEIADNVYDGFSDTYRKAGD
jgi:hypothetical protein